MCVCATFSLCFTAFLALKLHSAYVYAALAPRGLQQISRTVTDIK